MAIRDNLKANLDVSLAGSNVSVSSELPYSVGGETLYNKNMKYLYLDEDNIEVTELISCLDNNDVNQTETEVTGFLSVDAKNQPGDIDTIITSILNSRNAISNQTIRECEMTTENENDVITYTFNFRFVTV
jgi:predicted nucleotidyltransferase